ncbi:MAG: hypothetical protein V1799_14585 [bacterium]
MSRTRYKIFETHQPYFMTMTVVDWLPLFSQPSFAEIFISSLRFIHTDRRVTLYAYVLLEDHSHLIAHAEELPKVMKEFKSYTLLVPKLCLGTQDEKLCFNDERLTR